MDVDPPGAKWFKSTRSSMGKDCVEVAFLEKGVVGVRDSKNLAGCPLVFGAAEWDAFTAGLVKGQFGAGQS